jgi:hypothetical protein
MEPYRQRKHLADILGLLHPPVLFWPEESAQ